MTHWRWRRALWYLLPIPLNHSPSPRRYAGRREVLESSLDGIASWREHRFVAGEVNA